jgi:hypothetical protein
VGRESHRLPLLFNLSNTPNYKSGLTLIFILPPVLARDSINYNVLIKIPIIGKTLYMENIHNEPIPKKVWQKPDFEILDIAPNTGNNRK